MSKTNRDNKRKLNIMSDEARRAALEAIAAIPTLDGLKRYIIVSAEVLSLLEMNRQMGFDFSGPTEYDLDLISTPRNADLGGFINRDVRVYVWADAAYNPAAIRTGTETPDGLSRNNPNELQLSQDWLDSLHEAYVVAMTDGGNETEEPTVTTEPTVTAEPEVEVPVITLEDDRKVLIIEVPDEDATKVKESIVKAVAEAPAAPKKRHRKPKAKPADEGKSE